MRNVCLQSAAGILGRTQRGKIAQRSSHFIIVLGPATIIIHVSFLFLLAGGGYFVFLFGRGQTVIKPSGTNSAFSMNLLRASSSLSMVRRATIIAQISHEREHRNGGRW